MINHDIKNIYEWPLMAQFVIFCVIGLAILYLGYLIDIIPIKNAIITVTNEEQDLKMQFKGRIDRQVMIQRDISQVPKLQATLKDWESKFVSIDELPSLLDQIIKLGASAHVQINLFDPGAEEKDKEDKYYKVPVKLNVSGSYNQIASFMSQVANMQKLVVIGDFVIMKDTKGNQAENLTKPINADIPLSALLNLEIYRK